MAGAVRRSKYVSKFKFNQDLKDRFFKQLENNYAEETAIQYIKLIKKAGLYENYFDKDIYDFNLEELSEMFGGFGSTSKWSLNSQKPVFKLYYNYAVEEHYINNPIGYVNIIDKIKNDDLLNIEAINKKKMNRKQVYRLARRCANKQDALPALLLFETIKGKLCEDLLNIKDSDVDIVNNTIKVKNRIYNIPEETMVFIRAAMKEVKYYPENGKHVGKTPSLDKRIATPKDYISSGYLIKSYQTNDKLSYNGLVGRFKVLKSLAKTRYITPESFYESGIAEKIYLYLKKVSEEEFRDVEKKEITEYIKTLYPELSKNQIIRLLTIYFIDSYVANAIVATNE